VAKTLKLTRDGPRRLRTLPTMERLMQRAGAAVAQQAGADYGEPGQFGWASSPGNNRAAVAVFGKTFHADMDIARHPHILIGAMRAARRVV